MVALAPPPYTCAHTQRYTHPPNCSNSSPKSIRQPQRKLHSKVKNRVQFLHVTGTCWLELTHWCPLASFSFSFKRPSKGPEAADNVWIYATACIFTVITWYLWTSWTRQPFYQNHFSPWPAPFQAVSTTALHKPTALSPGLLILFNLSWPKIA